MAGGFPHVLAAADHRAVALILKDAPFQVLGHVVLIDQPGIHRLQPNVLRPDQIGINIGIC